MKTNFKEKIYQKNDWPNWQFCIAWYSENLKSNRKTFYFSSKSHFRIHTAKTWLIFLSLVSYKNQLKNTAIVVSLSTVHFPLSFTLKRSQIIAKGIALWIFNSSLTLNKEFVEKMKKNTYPLV